MSKEKQNNNKLPQRQQRSEETNMAIEFSEEFADVHEIETEAKGQEKRKGIQSIPFYRNG